MDMDKLKKWMEIAQKVQGGNFWGQIFDEEFAREHMNGTSIFSGFNDMGAGMEGAFPPIDMYESADKIYVLAALPGIQREDVFLALQGDKLVIRGRIASPFIGLKELKKEMKSGEFERAIPLPRLAKDNKLEASFQNGVLTIIYEFVGTPEENIPIK